MDLIISGMHCGSCKKLIEMELEEHKLDSHIEKFKLNGDNTGTLTLIKADDAIVDQIKTVVNNMDDYQVA